MYKKKFESLIEKDEIDLKEKWDDNGKHLLSNEESEQNKDIGKENSEEESLRKKIKDQENK